MNEIKTTYIDNEDPAKSFLKGILEGRQPPSYIVGVVLGDWTHDCICPVNTVAPTQKSFEDELLKCSYRSIYHGGVSSKDKDMKDIVPLFQDFEVRNEEGKTSNEIKEKMKTDIFVRDSFTGDYPVDGINNLIDCTKSQNLQTQQKRKDLYSDYPESLTFKHTYQLNCDILLFNHLKKDTAMIAATRTATGLFMPTDLSNSDLSSINYNIFVNLFWQKLIKVVETLVTNDMDILADNHGSQFKKAEIEEAIKILKKFKLKFHEGKLYLKHCEPPISASHGFLNDAIWVPSQKSLALEIINLDNKLPNVQPRGEEISAEQNKCIANILSYVDAASAAGVLLNLNNIKIVLLSLCKFLGDTSHIVMVYALLSQIKDDNYINLLLSERPMLIRNCLPDSKILNLFGIDDNKLDNLIIFVSKMKEINKLKGPAECDEDDNDEGEDDSSAKKVKCWIYIRNKKKELDYNKTKITGLIEKVKDEKKQIEEHFSNEEYFSNKDHRFNVKTFLNLKLEKAKHFCDKLLTETSVDSKLETQTLVDESRKILKNLRECEKIIEAIKFIKEIMRQPISIPVKIRELLDGIIKIIETKKNGRNNRPIEWGFLLPIKGDNIGEINKAITKFLEYKTLLSEIETEPNLLYTIYCSYFSGIIDSLKITLKFRS